MRMIRRPGVMTALVFAGLTMTRVAAGADPGAMAQAPGGAPAPKTYVSIPIYAVRTADDNGSHAATVTASKVQTLITGVNEIFADAGVQFTFDPAQDFPAVVNDSLLNQDCLLSPYVLLTNKDQEPVCDQVPNAQAREAYAVQHNDHVVVFFRWGTQITWDDSKGSWQVGPAGYATSSHCALRVRTTAGGGSGKSLAHELGHYFNCQHTFDSQPSTVAEAATQIWDYVVDNNLSKNAGLEVFDGDGLWDTPPDAGPGIFVSRFEDACSASGRIPIEVDYDPYLPNYTYMLEPDRGNVMSYFTNCPGPKHFSPMQIARITAALNGGNRSHLIGGKRGAYVTEEYKNTWSTGTSILTSFTLNDRAYVVAYSPDGAVRFRKVNDQEDSAPTAWSGTWSSQYTSMVPLELDGAPYLFLYKASTGYVTLVKINAAAQGASTVWSSTWIPHTNYTSIVPFARGGVAYVLMYRTSDGKARIFRFNGTMPDTLWTGTLEAGYTSVVPFDQDGESRLLLYKKNSGAVKIVAVNAGSQGVTPLWSDTWSSGYASISLLLRGGVEPHALLYHEAGSAKIVQIKPDALGVTTVWSALWSPGYTGLASFYVLHPSVVLYKAGSGAVQILEICL